jgi:endonuclease YncB( thermonuclease family)
MRRAIHVDSSEQTVRDLVAMLHQGAPADEFARRLADIDALPPSYPGKSTLVETLRMAMAVRKDWPVEPEGPEATAFTKDFVARAGQSVRLTFGLERKDRHDRFLAFVWNGDVMLNEQLVQAGLAHARLNYRYSGPMKRRLAAAEKEARAAKRGIWSEGQ